MRTADEDGSAMERRVAGMQNSCDQAITPRDHVACLSQICPIMSERTGLIGRANAYIVPRTFGAPGLQRAKPR